MGEAMRRPEDAHDHLVEARTIAAIAHVIAPIETEEEV